MARIYYNDVQLGTAIGKFGFSETYQKVSIDSQILVTATTSANLVVACDAIEVACKLKNKKTRVYFGSEYEYTYDPATKTGFKARVSLIKSKSESDLETSRIYNINMDLEIPYIENDYRRDGNFSISYGENRQATGKFTMVYTDGGANTAIQNYNTYGKAWASGIMSTFETNCELISENINQDDERNTCVANVTYNQILSKQTSGSTDYSKIVGASCNYEVNLGQLKGKSNTGGVTATPSSTVNLSYNANISKDATASDTSLEGIYRSTVKPWLIQQIKNLMGLSRYSTSGNNIIITNDSYNINPDTYTISGRVSALVPKSKSSVFIVNETVSYKQNNNIVCAKLWDGEDFTYNTYSTGKDLLATRSIEISKYGDYYNLDNIDPLETSVNQSGDWLLLDRSFSYKQEEYSNPNNVSGGTSVIISYQTLVEIYRFIKPVVYEPNTDPGAAIDIPVSQ